MSDYPRELLDPDGEGIYLYDDGSFPGVLMRAAQILHSDWREWRAVSNTVAYMQPGDDELWYPANIGRWPRGWRLNLPRRWRPVLFHYCTPIEAA